MARWIRRKTANSKKKYKHKTNTPNIFPWILLLILIGWTLWAIWHFSRSVIVPSLIKRVTPRKEKSFQEDFKEENEEEALMMIDEDEIFRKEMDLISGSTCKNGPSGVLLLKTHKTGSSTLANILNRYADQNNLLMAIPHRNSRFDWPHMFNVKSVDQKLMNNRRAQVLTNHARLNRVAMDEVMVPRTLYISILRDPVKQFESSFYYLEMHTFFGLKFSENPLQDFMQDPNKHMNKLKSRQKPENYGLFRDGMLFDLGYDQLELKRIGVRKAIEILEKEINLFLILEYFDESLLLLKKAMCWSLENILYFKQNQRTTKIPINTATASKIREWNKADVVLYEHFNATFWRKVKDYGPTFKEDLKELRHYIHEWSKRCDRQEVVKGKDASAVRFYKVGHKAKPEHREMCQRFFRKELEYIQEFRMSYFKEFHDKMQIYNKFKRSPT
ncbi:galactosylceramide sulfotransferase-like [Clytia hemisphaerica]|uniref:Uncharacterized protein n=1 Tax=Clytia hemisphaerica TaxID=252671 RepID=A0A7M5X5B9_9CNID